MSDAADAILVTPAIPRHVDTYEVLEADNAPASEKVRGVPASQALVTPNTVRELVAVYQEAEREIRDCFARMHDVEERLTRAFMMGETGKIHVDPTGRYRYGARWDDPSETLDEIRRTAWSCIVGRLQIKKVMSLSRIDELEKRLKDGKLPTITEESVTAFCEEYMDSIETMFAEAVREVFDWLRPKVGWGGEYKTNQKNARLELGEIIIRPGLIRQSGISAKPFAVCYGWGGGCSPSDRLSALERIFLCLDGKGMQTRGHRSALEHAIGESSDGKGQTDYFAFRAYKNGNLHITFRRQDLLAQLNRIAGGATLRPAE